MGSINLSNSKNRDALVHVSSVSTSQSVRWLDGRGRQAGNVRVIRATLDRDLPALLTHAGGDLAAVGDALRAGDPEVDLERVGGYLRDTARVYVDPDQKIVHTMTEWDVVKGPDGSVKDRRPHKPTLANVATETPLRWSGKLMKKSEVWNKFVFAAKLQVVHTNGLTFDFLYEMAKELELKDSLLLVGAGPKSNQPLCFRRGGTPYRGFLEGRVRGDSYCLILHLSNMELRAPVAEKA
jgi:hypothetical protein